MFILGIKEPDGTIGDIEVFDTMYDLREVMARSRASSGKNIGITAAKKQLVVFEEWSTARLFEAVAQNFEVLSSE